MSFLTDPLIIRKFQNFCGVNEDQNKNVIISSYTLYYFFKIVSSIADEIGYILWLPYICWTIPYGELTIRKVSAAWGLTMYIGQVLKELYKMPRPSYPVLQLEKHFATEYGFPSTHAMGSACYSIYIVWCFHKDNRLYDDHIIPYYSMAIAFIITVCLSRLYLGVHSLLDIIFGLIFGFLCLTFFILYGVEFDEFLLSFNISSLIMSGILLLILYPQPKEQFTSCFGTTALIIGTTIGIICGFITKSRDKLAIPMVSNDFNLFTSVLRLLCGVIVLFFVRLIVKNVCIQTLKFFIKLYYNVILKKNIQPSRKSYKVDVPTKFITYFCIGSCAAIIVPSIFRELNI